MKYWVDVLMNARLTPTVRYLLINAVSMDVDISAQRFLFPHHQVMWKYPQSVKCSILPHQLESNIIGYRLESESILIK